MKKLIVTFMAIFMLMTTVFNNVVFIKADEWVSPIACEYDEDEKTLFIQSVNNTVPSITKDHTLATDYPDVEVVIIQNGITSIGDYSFNGLTNLKTVSMPATLVSIGKGAFEGCTSLETVTIPSSVNGIAADAFKDCSELKYVTFSGSSVPTIATDAFSGISEDAVFYTLNTTEATLKKRLPATCKIVSYYHPLADDLNRRYVKEENETQEISDLYFYAAELNNENFDEITAVYERIQQSIGRYSSISNQPVFDLGKTLLTALCNTTEKSAELLSAANILLEELDKEELLTYENTFRNEYINFIGKVGVSLINAIVELEEADSAKLVTYFETVNPTVRELIDEDSEAERALINAEALVVSAFFDATAKYVSCYDDFKAFTDDVLEAYEESNSTLVNYYSIVAASMFNVMGANSTKLSDYVEEYNGVVTDIKNTNSNKSLTYVKALAEMTAAMYTALEVQYENETALKDTLASAINTFSYDSYKVASVSRYTQRLFARTVTSDYVVSNISWLLNDLTSCLVNTNEDQFEAVESALEYSLKVAGEGEDNYTNYYSALAEFVNYHVPSTHYSYAYYVNELMVEKTLTAYTTLDTTIKSTVTTALNKALSTIASVESGDYERVFFIAYTFLGYLDAVQAYPENIADITTMFNSIVVETGYGEYASYMGYTNSKFLLAYGADPTDTTFDDVYSTLKTDIKSSLGYDKAYLLSMIGYSYFDKYVSDNLAAYHTELTTFTAELIAFAEDVTSGGGTYSKAYYMINPIVGAYNAYENYPDKENEICDLLNKFLGFINDCTTTYGSVTNNYNKHSAISSFGKSAFDEYTTDANNATLINEVVDRVIEVVAEKDYGSAANFAYLGTKWLYSVCVDTEKAATLKTTFNSIVADVKGSKKIFEYAITHIGGQLLVLYSNDNYDNYHKNYDKIYDLALDAFDYLEQRYQYSFTDGVNYILRMIYDTENLYYDELTDILGDFIAKLYSSKGDKMRFYGTVTLCDSDLFVTALTHYGYVVTSDKAEEEDLKQALLVIDRAIDISSLLVVGYDQDDISWGWQWVGTVYDKADYMDWGENFVAWHVGYNGYEYSFDTPVEIDLELYPEYHYDPPYEPPVYPPYDPQKQDPTYEVPTGIVVEYGTKLGDITLPTGFEFTEDPATKFDELGEHSFPASYTPDDTTTYNVITDIQITVTVEKADPTYEVPTGLTAYVGDYLNDVELPYGFSWQDPLTTSVGDEGTNKFKVVYTPDDTTNYNIITDIEVDVVVSENTRAIPTYETPTGLTAYEGGTLADVVLPEGFKFQDDPTTSVGKVGQRKFKVTYTPSDLTTYSPVHDIEVTVTVSKKPIAIKTIGPKQLVDKKAKNKYGEHQVIVESTKEFDSNITLIVKVVVGKSSTKVNVYDYNKISDPALKLKSNEKVGIVYDVKLMRTVDGVTTPIQPSDLEGVTSIKVLMLLPESLDVTKVTRILHVHNNLTVEEYEFNTDNIDENGYYEMTITGLSEFAFIYEKDANPIVDPNPSASMVGTGVESEPVVKLIALATLTASAIYVARKKKNENN